MSSMRANVVASIRLLVAANLALGMAFVAPLDSYAGPGPICDIECNLDKKCSVGGSEPQDSCDTTAGEEVTYSYHVSSMGHTVRVFDDKLGVIGDTSSLVTKTTTLTETTVNEAWISSLDECFCVFGIGRDSVTVTFHVETSTPTPSATPTATPVPTPTPTMCAATWPETRIVTLAKGQSPTNNVKVTHAITGHIIDPDSLSDTAHRIEVCAGTRVTSVVTDTTGSATNTAGGSLSCAAGGCWGDINVTEKYQSYSEDGQDKDSITFLPK